MAEKDATDGNESEITHVLVICYGVIRPIDDY